MATSDAAAANAHWGRPDLERRILDALAAAGKDLDALTIEDLGPADHFHGGGKAATDRLARLAQLTPGARVLDVSGAGSAARRARWPSSTAVSSPWSTSPNRTCARGKR
jgi:hypothetical protein